MKGILRSNLQLLIDQESHKPGELTEDIQTVNSKLELNDIERYGSALVRARTERLISRETPTKRALGAGKWHAQKKHVELERDCIIIKGTKQIIKTFSDYYRALLAKDVADNRYF